MKSNYLNLVIWLLGSSLAVSIAVAEEETDVSELNAKFQRLYATKQFNRAAPIAEKILQINEKTRGPEDRKTAVAANNLAEVYRYMGEYAKAEPLYERALKVFEKELGPEHPDLASVLSNIALLDSETGAYDKAETLYQRALKSERRLSVQIIRKQRQPECTGALYYYDEYAKAEPLISGRSRFEKVFGRDEPEDSLHPNDLELVSPIKNTQRWRFASTR
jgi:tetratricopeptide (TPR) repeat protein